MVLCYGSPRKRICHSTIYSWNLLVNEWSWGLFISLSCSATWHNTIYPFYFEQLKYWQPTPVFLPGESHGQLAGYSPQGCTVRHDWLKWLSTHARFTYRFFDSTNAAALKLLHVGPFREVLCGSRGQMQVLTGQQQSEQRYTQQDNPNCYPLCQCDRCKMVLPGVFNLHFPDS